jgi:hypothetical protein
MSRLVQRRRKVTLVGFVAAVLIIAILIAPLLTTVQAAAPPWSGPEAALATEVRDKGWIAFSASTGQGGWAELWVADGDGKEKSMRYAEEGRHIYGACPSPDGKYLLFTRSEKDLGGADGAGTRLTIIRWDDAPMVGGTSVTFRKKYPQARLGPRLDLSIGWEPCWTYSEIGATR